jgi:hypothetical protein
MQRVCRGNAEGMQRVCRQGMRRDQKHEGVAGSWALS